MNEAGQPHDPRWIMHRAVAAESSGERLLQRLEILERYLAGEAPIGVEATRRGFHHDVRFHLGAVHRLNWRAVEIDECRTDANDVGFLAAFAVSLVDGNVNARAAPVELD